MFKTEGKRIDCPNPVYTTKTDMGFFSGEWYKPKSRRRNLWDSNCLRENQIWNVRKKTLKKPERRKKTEKLEKLEKLEVFDSFRRQKHAAREQAQVRNKMSTSASNRSKFRQRVSEIPRSHVHVWRHVCARLEACRRVSVPICDLWDAFGPLGKV